MKHHENLLAVDFIMLCGVLFELFGNFRINPPLSPLGLPGPQGDPGGLGFIGSPGLKGCKGDLGHQGELGEPGTVPYLDLISLHTLTHTTMG